MATIGADVEEIRAGLFVGREDELGRLARLLAPGGPRVACVSGPGGIGKSELLAALARRVSARGVRVARIDGGLVACSEMAVADAVRRALEAASGADDRTLLIVDRYEALAALDAWARDVLLPSLPAATRVVIAGRDAMPAWSTEAPWRAVTDAIALGPLAPPVADEYLARRGVPAERRADVTRCSRGHPLALVLLAEIALRDPTIAASLVDHPTIVQALLERFVAVTSDPAQREALWCGAVVKHLSEELLAAMRPPEPSMDVFRWLARLPFVSVTPHGLALHDLVRELLDADLAWRFPALRRRLIARAAGYYRSRLDVPSARTVVLHSDVAYLWRDAVPYTAAATAGCVPSSMRPADRAEVEAMIVRHQSPTAWRWFERWRERGADVLLVRGADGRPQAVALYLWLERADPELARQDPGTAGVMAYLESTGELAGMVYRRLHVDRDANQDLAPSTLVITGYEFDNVVCRPGTRDILKAWIDPEVGLGELPPGMFERVPAADFAQDALALHVLRTTARGADLFAWTIDRVFMPLLRAGEPADAGATKGDDALGALTRRQREVAEHVSRGLTNKEIAAVLGTSPHTVRNQLVQIFERLGIATRSELAALVARTS
ncbi:MAG: AAA family ATPase [Deltaproteobacteria bacterium]|nr:AAA family ATPase [Deltaproteobacteria bacterium]